MAALEQLLDAFRQTPKRLCVIGEAMEDVWITGELSACQDACPSFKETYRLSTPGGAAGAVRQLVHWPGVERFLISPLRRGFSCRHTEGWQDVPRDLTLTCRDIPTKKRWLIGDRIVFRSDEHDDPWNDAVDLNEWRYLAMKAVETMNFDGVLISDYDKGFLGKVTIKLIVDYCNNKGIPVVCDAKRKPSVYDGSILKCNADYFGKWFSKEIPLHNGMVVTAGEGGPSVFCGKEHKFIRGGAAVRSVNHVGAGDCFAVHLLLGLVCGQSLEKAATVAHSAGRVYVQHRHGRPPWPHEIRKDLQPSLGKVWRGSPSSSMSLAALRESIQGRLVFTNGVFRLLTPAHVQFLSWAKEQGEVLVVGINDDLSVCNLRGTKGYILPLEERVKMLAALECVDWIVPYQAPDPRATIRELQPDLLVKGHEYAGTRIPGDDLVREVRFSPDFPGGHATDLERSIRL